MAAVVLLIGFAQLAAAVNQWRLSDFGHLDYAQTMRLVIPGVTLTALLQPTQRLALSGNRAAWTLPGGFPTFDPRTGKSSK
jgi:hypothetical protein